MHSSHSAKCLTPAAVLIRCSACCCGVLLGLRLLGCAVKKKKKKKKFFIELLLPQICSTATSHGSKVSFQKDTKTKTDEESHISLVIAWFFLAFFSLLMFICDSLSVLLHVKSI